MPSFELVWECHVPTRRSGSGAGGLSPGAWTAVADRRRSQAVRLVARATSASGTIPMPATRDHSLSPVHRQDDPRSRLVRSRVAPLREDAILPPPPCACQGAVRRFWCRPAQFSVRTFPQTFPPLLRTRTEVRMDRSRCMMRVLLLPLAAFLATTALAADTTDLQARRRAPEQSPGRAVGVHALHEPRVRLDPGRQALERPLQRLVHPGHLEGPREAGRVPEALRGDRHRGLPRPGAAQQDPDGAAARGEPRRGALQELGDARRAELRHPDPGAPARRLPALRHGQGLRRLRRTRTKSLPRQFEDSVANIRSGMADGLMPPKFLLDKVVPQAEGLASGWEDIAGS